MVVACLPASLTSADDGGVVVAMMVLCYLFSLFGFRVAVAAHAILATFI